MPVRLSDWYAVRLVVGQSEEEKYYLADCLTRSALAVGTRERQVIACCTR